MFALNITYWAPSENFSGHYAPSTHFDVISCAVSPSKSLKIPLNAIFCHRWRLVLLNKGDSILCGVRHLMSVKWTWNRWTIFKFVHFGGYWVEIESGKKPSHSNMSEWVLCNKQLRLNKFLGGTRIVGLFTFCLIEYNGQSGWHAIKIIASLFLKCSIVDSTKTGQ